MKAINITIGMLEEIRDLQKVGVGAEFFRVIFARKGVVRV